MEILVLVTQQSITSVQFWSSHNKHLTMRSESKQVAKASGGVFLPAVSASLSEGCLLQTFTNYMLT